MGAWDPVTHGYIGHETAKVVEIICDSQPKKPDLQIFESGSISHDVFHIVDESMHNNQCLINKMHELAGSLNEKTFAAAFQCHSVADGVWAKWADSNGIPRGGIYIPVEWYYEFLFASYAVLFKGYCVPSSLTFYSGLVQNAYKKLTGKELSRDFLDTAFFAVFLGMLGEFILIMANQVSLRLFLESPIGDGALVRNSFQGVVDEAMNNSKMSIESRWYDFKEVGVFKVEHKSGILKGHRWVDTSNWPRLTEGWERSHWDYVKETEYHEHYLGRDWSGWRVEWATGDKYDPNVKVSTWADAGRNYVRVDVKPYARRRQRPSEATVERLEIPQPLLAAIREKKARISVSSVEPLLTKLGVTVKELEDRQREIMMATGKAVKDTCEDVQKGRLVTVVKRPFKPVEFTWKEELVDLVAKKSAEIECNLSIINALEKKKR